MALIDNQFISRLVECPQEDWVGSGVTARMLSADTRAVYEFILTEYNEGSVPKKHTVSQFFASFTFEDCPEHVDFYARKILDRFKERRLIDTVRELTDNLSGDEPDIEAAEELMSSSVTEISNLGSGHATSISFGKNPSERLAAFDALSKGLSADFSLGHKVWDEDLIGAERGNFFLIAGTPAAGKSWLLLKTLMDLHRQGLNIMLFSYELSKKLLLRRMDSITAKVPYKLFRRGLMTSEERKHFSRSLGFLAKRKNFFEIITTENCDPFSKVGPYQLEFVYSKIKHFKPDIVAIDGFYLMQGKGKADWERMAYLSRGFHSITQATGVAGWATTQLTKTSDEKNPRLRDLSYSWAFAQDTDGVFLLSKGEDDQRIVTVGKFREAEDSMRYHLNFNPGADIDVQRMAPPTDNPLMD